MASLRDVIKRGATIDIDRGQLEIEKELVKARAKKVFGGFTGIHSSSQKEQKENIKKRNEEYLKEHNKMFEGYNGARRRGLKVTSGSSGPVIDSRIKQDGKDLKEDLTVKNEPRSRMRVGGETCSGQRGSSSVYLEKRNVQDRTAKIRPTRNDRT